MNKFSLQQCIGRGNFGDVYRAENNQSGQVVAIKVINLEASDEDVSSIIQEIQILSRMKSNHITKYFETLVCNMSMWIVMEYCGGGSCSDLLKCHKRLSEDTTSFIIRGTMLGLCYLHSQKKVHRDIKSANILLTNHGDVKLADFGVSGEITLTHAKRNTFVGTPFWMAPEVIKGRNGGYDEKADIWSIGITTIELVTGLPPLSEHDPMKILFQIPTNNPPTLDSNATLTYNVKDFVKYALKKDPSHRPTAKKLLQHKFLKIRRGGHTGLISLIEAKNLWMEQKYSGGRRPKFELEDQLSTTSNIDMKGTSDKSPDWDFDTNKSFRIAKQPSTKSSPSSQSNLPQSNTGSNSTDVSSPPNQSPIMLSSSKSAAKNYLDDIIMVCLGRVAQRAKTVETKRTVESLARNFMAYEALQPGMCEAIVEEICLYVNELVANEK